MNRVIDVYTYSVVLLGGGVHDGTLASPDITYKCKYPKILRESNIFK